MTTNKKTATSPPVTPVILDLTATKAAIELAGNAYAKRNMRQPTAITLRRDVVDALHHSPHGFLFDFVDMTLTRERFMGMDVTVVEDGPEFSIVEPKGEGDDAE